MLAPPEILYPINDGLLSRNANLIDIHVAISPEDYL
jgi:hypothetical protein